MSILVTGGAGYIGSHVVKLLGEAGEDVVVVDNLSTGHRAAVTHGQLVEADLSDDAAMSRLFQDHRFESVMHFAAAIVVPESVRDPLRYYGNNTVNTHRLLGHCVRAGVDKLIFSSTAAVYGMPSDGICAEDGPVAPINPYGSSKLMSEQMIRDVSALGSLRSVILRYFNVAGADSDGEIGQSNKDATHLLKVACQAALGHRGALQIYGDDYATPDGTCIRDYIHVMDLAQAHVQALTYLRGGGVSTTLNCGYGQGYSVSEVVQRVRQAIGHDFPVEVAPRRPGDPPHIVARAEKIRQVLGWQPRHQDLDLIVRSTLAWEKQPRY